MRRFRACPHTLKPADGRGRWNMRRNNRIPIVEHLNVQEFGNPRGSHSGNPEPTRPFLRMPRSSPLGTAAGRREPPPFLQCVRPADR
jgi:hypothetical protein